MRAKLQLSAPIEREEIVVSFVDIRTIQSSALALKIDGLYQGLLISIRRHLNSF